jgi:hypothetical protein
MTDKKKESGMQKRMQSFYFEFLNEDGESEIISDSDETEEEGKPSRK